MPLHTNYKILRISFLSLLSAAKAGNIIDAPVKTEAINTGNMYGQEQHQIKGRGIIQSQEQETGKQYKPEQDSARNEKGQTRAWGMKRNGQNINKGHETQKKTE
ncbi:uncharacterized protein N7477_005534 [Penicillium maclennaniae]|uniref:uncharacterized protein n=1 Tax=Penicillium maclennaniae TaxID=1343394 RepID=UPI002540DEF8|nr:uncharacterized protein N7477_005534 [Penicillium maclennaniae]KAJ5670171.1 hypothetical protein N7477_005534 [Penicillium maclennaniae]